MTYYGLGIFTGFSPRKRRCFWVQASKQCEVAVFSAQAEVFLKSRAVKLRDGSFLRASGGVSQEYGE